ncbi:MAG: hypothetical protein WBX00_10935 [Isosphaeraceae bacterium]|jgi:hypothetical protein
MGPLRTAAKTPFVEIDLARINAFIIGFENTGQIDDLLKRTADAIAFLKA